MNLKLLKCVAFLALVFCVISCASKKEESTDQATEEKEWKDMDDFHAIMAETFHPYKDSANLEPVKSRAGELAAAAEKWAGASLPEKVNNDEMKGRLGQLKSETASLAQLTSTGDDTTVGDQLTKVHDLFHEIQEAWYGGGEGEEHDH